MNTQVEKSQGNILIVDDTPDNLDLLAAILKKRGYQTQCVDNGAEAIEVAQSQWAELILLDIQMPEMDGYEVCQQLKADALTKEIPVIFISALNNFTDKKKAFKVGGIDYINKPFEIKEVVVRVANQIAIAKSKRQIVELNNQLEQKVQERTADLEKSNQQLKDEINRRQQAQDRLLKMALNDPITGYANRNSFISRLKKALRDTEVIPSYFFAVILLECDRFRNIKRTLSHIDSNQLLMAIAHTIDSCLPETALLSRLEGEEFGIFLDSISDVKDVVAMVRAIQEKFNQPLIIKQCKILVNINAGIVIGNQDYRDPDRLFNDADIAMQQAKEQDGDRILVFQPDMYIQLQEDVESSKHEIALKQAIKRQEFVNHYLPSISLKDHSAVELEALVRWHSPKKGIVLPVDFIDRAEAMGLMNAIGNLVLKQACQDLQKWHQNHQDWNDLSICINLSAKQLFHQSLIPKVDMILRKIKIQGRHIKFDISETVALENPKMTLQVLQQLKKRQIRLCLDNFGSGYSSLTCLHQFPFDEIKIDRSVIANIAQANLNLENEKYATLLLEQIINIAHQMNMLVSATGIENSYQLNLLKNLGCDRGQGYFISKLLKPESVEKFLLWSTDNIHDLKTI
ncbi:EAL domain-containing protein [Waterburya agarophytonicola K14]|uniref:EAL domain-containing protein n=1 Tax=Waterburya agarophytonicola KI4 TaxID=2874699 RepID=A0A964FG06_9CYAN|nr:EAL domain-containing response regulator [Waterburya agarophytonicola]MCC0176054.1 EAL domain-containing protein [Waterburya agarophytonicola KI4]